MIFSTLSLYAVLCSFSCLIHISDPNPTAKNPKNYGLSTCSGVFIGPDTVLTANHCVAESRGHQWIKTDDGISYSAIILRKDKIKDLALLKVMNMKNHAYANLGLPTDISQKVYTVNSGHGYEHTYNEGIVNNLFEEEDTNTLQIMHNTLIWPGASGSGLFNSRGELIGINVAVMKGLSAAVDITVVKEFLRVR